MNELPFGVDISKYQFSEDGSKKPDFNLIRQTCNFIAIRAGISWGYTDPWFRYSWDAVRGMPRMAYHVPYFGESAERQMDNFFNIVEPVSDWDFDRLVLDCEVQGSNSPALITATTNKMLAICKARTGRYPIIYSRALWVNEHLRVKDLPKLDWWLAQYRFRLPSPLFTPEYPPPPNLPNGVSDWLIHQTSEAYNGASVGVVSRYVDSNRWNGTVADVLKYFSRESNTPEPEPEPPTADGMYKIELLGNLVIRKTPNGDPTGSHALVGEVYYTDVRDGAWYRITRAGVTGWIASGQWTAITVNTPDPEPEPPYQLTDRERLDRLWDAHPELHQKGSK